MHDSCVDADAARVAQDLSEAAGRHALALAGGTACALRLGHRISRDLDFFALRALDPPALLGDLAPLAEQRLRGISDKEIAVVVRGVQVSATSLGRPPLEPPDEWNGISVLSAIDLAELKVEASVRRGMVRDLCDLHLLCLGGADLETALRASPIDAVVALQALSDIERFQGQPELELRRPWSLEEAVRYFAAEARRLLG